ncbi:MAG: calcium-binding protein, partial [Gammaproteobacteria bacterium]|nr:calcium-binding protein [Gammaproteobacteria bacterium]
GHDTLMGGPGNDRLSGGAGDDAMFGGAGADLFVIAPDNGNDYLGDFLFGDDRIDLTDFAEIESVDDLRIEQQAGDLIVDLSNYGGGQLRLYDLQPEELADDHFIFFTHDL